MALGGCSIIRRDSPIAETTTSKPRAAKPALIGLAVFAVVLLAGLGLAFILDLNRPSPVVADPIKPGPTTPASSIGDLESGPLEPRLDHSLVWTGSELIVWGGCADRLCTEPLADGASYNPRLDTWNLIAPTPLAPRSEHLAVWTGEEMLIVGGAQSDRTGAAYSRATHSWRSLPEAPIGVRARWADGRGGRMSGVWDGNRFIIWEPEHDRLVGYWPDEDRWSQLEPIGLVVDNGRAQVVRKRTLCTWSFI